jgi:hypothetical protein
VRYSLSASDSFTGTDGASPKSTVRTPLRYSPEISSRMLLASGGRRGRISGDGLLRLVGRLPIANSRLRCHDLASHRVVATQG